MKSDIDLRQDVLDELEWEPSIDAAAIGVAVSDGVVTLTGYVESYAEQRRAEEIVMRVEGVRGVAEELEVKLPGSRKRSDSDIAQVAADAISWHVLLPEGRIKVRVEDGHVTLIGEVDWEYERRSAERAVRDLVGVKKVSNTLTIRERPTPDQVQHKIESALERAVARDARNIKVKVDGSEVTLEGQVQSFFERREAVRAAWRASGVTKVTDRIKIEPSVYAPR